MTTQDRINEIKKKILETYPNMEQASNFDMLALYTYLDEEKERINRILHEIVDSIQTLAVSNIEHENTLHAMIDETVTSSDE